MKAVLASLLLYLTTSSLAFADSPTGLLFLSLEGAQNSRYGGIGWMEAPRGLDNSGPILLVELGAAQGWRSHGAAMAGWRHASGRTTTTLLGGVEFSAKLRPTASAGIWWDDAGWMATTRAEATTDDASWRGAVGWRSVETLPWAGPEVSYKDDEFRFGAHATGIKLPVGFEARTSTGWSAGNVYGELSVWRRF